VTFIRAKHIEVFQTDQRIEDSTLFGVHIKPVFGKCVTVQWTKAMEFFLVVVHAGGAITVGSRRGGVDEAQTPFHRPFGKISGKSIIVPHQIAEILFCSGGART
jgi:hypothetical protein